MDSAAALKCNGYGFESLLAEYLDKQRQCTLEGEVWYMNVQESVHWGVVYIGDPSFANLSLKLTYQEVTCLIRH